MMFPFQSKATDFIDIFGGGNSGGGCMFFSSFSLSKLTLRSRGIPNIMDKRFCILHLDAKSNEEVRHFDDRTWAKVLNAHATRRQVYTQSKYMYFGIT